MTTAHQPPTPIDSVTSVIVSGIEYRYFPAARKIAHDPEKRGAWRTWKKFLSREEADAAWQDLTVQSETAADKLLVRSARDDRALAKQLSEQYQCAVGGLWEVVKFGAMMLHLRDAILSTRGQVRTGGAASKDTGIDGWLKQHCPEIKHATAYRFMAVAAAVREEINLGGKADLLQLLESNPGALEPKLLKKYQAVQHLIEGSSQRQLLLQFGDAHKPPPDTGGANWLQKFLREHFPDEVGKRAKDLSPKAAAAWKAHLDEIDKKRPTKEELADEYWEDIENMIHNDLSVHKRYTYLSLARLQVLSKNLLDAKRTVDALIAKG
jgi:hypothetical protein